MLEEEKNGILAVRTYGFMSISAVSFFDLTRGCAN